MNKGQIYSNVFSKSYEEKKTNAVVLWYNNVYYNLTMRGVYIWNMSSVLN